MDVSLQRPYSLSKVDHIRKSKDRKQRTDIGKYSFVNRVIQVRNQLPAEVLGTFPCKPKIFRKILENNYKWGDVNMIEVWRK
jgi:hypothetical protein